MRFATLHRPDGKTILVNPDNVIALSEPWDDLGSGNCIVIFTSGYQQPVSENLAAAAAMIEGTGVAVSLTQLGRSQ